MQVRIWILDTNENHDTERDKFDSYTKKIKPVSSECAVHNVEDSGDAHGDKHRNSSQLSAAIDEPNKQQGKQQGSSGEVAEQKTDRDILAKDKQNSERAKCKQRCNQLDIQSN